MKEQFTIEIKANSEKDCQDCLEFIKITLPKFSEGLEYKSENYSCKVIRKNYSPIK